MGMPDNRGRWICRSWAREAGGCTHGGSQIGGGSLRGGHGQALDCFRSKMPVPCGQCQACPLAAVPQRDVDPAAAGTRYGSRSRRAMARSGDSRTWRRRRSDESFAHPFPAAAGGRGHAGVDEPVRDSNAERPLVQPAKYCTVTSKIMRPHPRWPSAASPCIQSLRLP